MLKQTHDDITPSVSKTALERVVAGQFEVFGIPTEAHDPMRQTGFVG
jgi:hypothetical protein